MDFDFHNYNKILTFVFKLVNSVVTAFYVFVYKITISWVLWTNSLDTQTFVPEAYYALVQKM